MIVPQQGQHPYKASISSQFHTNPHLYASPQQYVQVTRPPQLNVSYVQPTLVIEQENKITKWRKRFQTLSVLLMVRFF